MPVLLQSYIQKLTFNLRFGVIAFSFRITSEWYTTVLTGRSQWGGGGSFDDWRLNFRASDGLVQELLRTFCLYFQI